METKQLIKIFSAILFFLLALISTNINGQNTFNFSSSVLAPNWDDIDIGKVDSETPVPVIINSIQYYFDSSIISIPTNYPRFDTLIFGEDLLSNGQIICNFKPDSTYIIIGVCCGNFDIIPYSRYISRNGSCNETNPFLDCPYISIKTKKTPNDSIYAWYEDIAHGPRYRKIDTELWNFGIPTHDNPYWNNCTTIRFYREIEFKEKNSIHQYNIKNLNGINAKEISRIRFRLFDDEQFVIVYDEESNNATIEYEQ